jgi:hypothetical protein
MFLRLAVVGAALPLLALPVNAWADPSPAPSPPVPNVNAYKPLNPSDYAVPGTTWYGFAGPPGVICIINRANSDYGCSGPLPGAPSGANLVSGGPVGAPGFSATAQPLFLSAGGVKALPPGSRLSFRDISCGVDETGTVACWNSRDQVGFVVSSTGSFVNTSNPMLDRPDGTTVLPGLPPMMPGLPPG